MDTSPGSAKPGLVYGVEMQVAAEGNVARRARYYHAMLDIESLNGGEDYNELPVTYVIFIGAGPLLGKGFDPVPSRTFQRCDLSTGQPLGDGAATVILDASAWEDAQGELRGMLELIRKGGEASALEDGDGIASALQSAMDKVKESEVDMAIMSAAAEIDRLEKLVASKEQYIADLEFGCDDFALAVGEAEAKGEARLAKLVVAMNNDGRSDELAKCVEDPERREELMREFGIE